MIGDLQPKFQEIWSNFSILKIFALKKQGFPPYAPRHVAHDFARELQIKKNCISRFGMKNYGFLFMAKKFGQVLSPQKVKKHSKNNLTSPILTHKNQSWEIRHLEVKMNTKSRNSTFIGKYIGRAFQQAILGSILTSGSASKLGPKWHDA